MRVAEIWKRCPLALRDSLPAWVLARLIVAASLAGAKFIVDDFPQRAIGHRNDLSLIGWDGEFYELIARAGYAADADSYRFFPLYPLASKALNFVTPGSTTVALVLLANVCSLGFVVLLHHLVQRETGDVDLARRAAWFGCIAPAAFVMVWGYAEPTFLLLAVATFLMLRTDRFAAAGLFGALAALTRPLGVLIAISAAFEASRGFRNADVRGRAERVVAVAGPPIGTLAYLLWTLDRTGDFLEPYRIQALAVHRGKTVDPVTGIANALSEFFDHDRIGPLFHVGWAVVAVALVVVTFRRLPASYGLFSAATVIIALSSHNLDSFERYAFNAFPLIIVVAMIFHTRRQETLAFTAAGALMLLYGTLAALSLYVP
ncbi:MAG: mannosyltransferase family protein [Acidimicrobiia bacterium]